MGSESSTPSLQSVYISYIVEILTTHSCSQQVGLLVTGDSGDYGDTVAAVVLKSFPGSFIRASELVRLGFRLALRLGLISPGVTFLA